MKTCSNCKQSKPVTLFYVHNDYKDGHHSECKKCIKSRISEKRSADEAPKKTVKAKRKPGQSQVFTIIPRQSPSRQTVLTEDDKRLIQKRKDREQREIDKLEAESTTDYLMGMWDDIA